MHLATWINGSHSLSQREGDLLDEHARLLLAGHEAGAKRFRLAQPPALASLMLLAEHLARAYAPVSMRAAQREWLLRILLPKLPKPNERIATVWRVYGRDAMLGAALVGTAYSLGRVAWSLYRKRQDETVNAA